MTHEELRKSLHDAHEAMQSISDCGSIPAYVIAAADAWKNGAINTEDYAKALSTAWTTVRKCYLAERQKPTIEELETILKWSR